MLVETVLVFASAWVVDDVEFEVGFAIVVDVVSSPERLVAGYPLRLIDVKDAVELW